MLETVELRNRFVAGIRGAERHEGLPRVLCHLALASCISTCQNLRCLNRAEAFLPSSGWSGKTMRSRLRLPVPLLCRDSKACLTDVSMTLHVCRNLALAQVQLRMRAKQRPRAPHEKHMLSTTVEVAALFSAFLKLATSCQGRPGPSEVRGCLARASRSNWSQWGAKSAKRGGDQEEGTWRRGRAIARRTAHSMGGAWSFCLSGSESLTQTSRLIEHTRNLDLLVVA